MPQNFDVDDVHKVADELADGILSNGQTFLDLAGSGSPTWSPIPSMSTEPLTFGAVDGGSRTFQGRGAYLIFAQAAGRPMGVNNSPLPRDIAWEIKRDGKALSTGGSFINDLASRLRERLELTVAADLIERYSPDYLLLDGTLEGLFIIGLPTRISVSQKYDRESLDADFVQFQKELVAYGEVLHELLDLAESNGTTILGISKDSYSKKFLPEKYLDSALNDPMYFSMVTDGQPGFSETLTSHAYDRILSSPGLEALWKDNGIKLDEKDCIVKTFFATVVPRGIPIRIDYFVSNTKPPSQLLSDLLTVSDGKDWFIPPRLAHEKSVVKSDVFESLLKQVYKRIERENPMLAKLIIGSTRRSRTQ